MQASIHWQRKNLAIEARFFYTQKQKGVFYNGNNFNINNIYFSLHQYTSMDRVKKTEMSDHRSI